MNLDDLTKEFGVEFDRMLAKERRRGRADINTIPRDDEQYRARFMRFVMVNATTDCWEWQGAVNRGGYGLFSAYKGGRGGKMASAHRVSYVLHCGDIPDGVEIAHACDNTSCVAPHHLSITDHSTNMRQMRDRKRSRNVVMTPDLVRLLRWLRASYNLKRSDLACLFGILPASVHNIVAAASWKDIEMPPKDWNPGWRVTIDHDAGTVERLHDSPMMSRPRMITPRARAVETPQGRFGSLTAAARAAGCHVSTACYRATNGTKGWRYLD